VESNTKERRIVFLLVILCLLPPIVLGMKLPPAPLSTADTAFNYIEKEPEAGKGHVVVVAVDFGPGTAAENKPQAKVIIEHLLRKRIPFALTSIYVLATPFLQELPLEIIEELREEMPDESWEYGRDWVNLGYLPGGFMEVQSLARAKDWRIHLKTDAAGNVLSELPIMESLKSIRDVRGLVQITGLIGTFSAWLQFFQIKGHIPVMLHGCTSITIPDAYMFYASGQMHGLFEGIAGAAWYEHRMNEAFPERVIDSAQSINTGTSFAQILVVLLVLLGNAGLIFKWMRRRRA
jgi:hypothetical protein